ncbi:alanine/glycine:cation symporter family protein [Candidatus Cetobacterium colombiensis]|uniref:Alanine/glycine:cation symporter family protein n=1 Tax=Candidatus Cetobacterium colombiensis TaxID=3073100 RepID=A0ABU4W9S1_9FUSO|nr:alanine/glycine:cation symporter family protein [Candidatus Cetobacterium colombiensis]MDX8336281.1 alanine/glycine:cation symporter family protein [Candidatus Cetobacterium colombiensis]
MEILKLIINEVNKILWEKNILVILLIGMAVYTSYKTKFMQIRLFGEIVKTLKGESTDGQKMSSLEAFYLGTACRVGAGNIAGVVAAISVGGPGALFWMWLVALLGASTSFVESVLAVVYREKDSDGNYRGGTPWIIKNRLKKRGLGIVYAISSIICYIGAIQVMSNSVTESVVGAYKLNPKLVAIFLSVIVAITIFGKSKKDSIIQALNKIVPAMACMYLIVVIFVIVTNISSIPLVFSKIFSSAFGITQIAGGTLGGIIMQGVKRGLFSNEAGSGNGNYAAALADVEEPVKQGMVQSLSVFVDTLVICSATAFVILLADENVTIGLNGMILFQEALKSHIGWIGIPFTVVILFFFSFSTILGVTFYGKNALQFISESSKLNFVYKIIVILMVYIGGIEQNYFVWSLADFGLGLMTIINIIAITPLIKESIFYLEKYEQKLKGYVKINP